MQNKKHILLFGSGLMAESVVIYLLRRPENCVHIASNIVEDAKKIAENNDPNRCTYGDADVTNQEQVGKLVRKSDIVISYVPAFLHIHIAKVCLQEKKNLVTASYVSPQMKELDEKVKENGLIFLNELGLDPGIDHLATMKIVDEVAKQGGKITEYESWCGGLPSPQFCDNPIGYKFTWSPIGALRALNNKAIYIDDDKQVAIESKDLQYYGATIDLNAALSLEGYPNRNSVAYKDIYGLKDAKKVLRGTLRYKGFCTVINAWKELGFLEQTEIKGQKWLEYLKEVLLNEEGATLEDKIKSKCFNKVPQYANINGEEKAKKFNHVIKAFKYFDFFNPETKIWDSSKSKIENLVKLLENKLSLQEGETDLIAMQHIFLIEKDGKKIIKKSSLIQIGQKKGKSAMSITVGTPTAIGAQLILDNGVSERGVLIPKYPDIYNPVLEKLAEYGVKLVDSDEVL